MCSTSVRSGEWTFTAEASTVLASTMLASLGGDTRRQVRAGPTDQAAARRRLLGRGDGRLRLLRSRPGASRAVQPGAVDRVDGRQAVSGDAQPGRRHEARLIGPISRYVVRTFRSAVSGRPEGLHYIGRGATRAASTRFSWRPRLWVLRHRPLSIHDRREVLHLVVHFRDEAVLALLRVALRCVVVRRRQVRCQYFLQRLSLIA